MDKSGLIDELRSRLDIVEVVGEYLSLKKVGRNYVALCPFHVERTPSFTVSPEKQIFYCFGCGKGGDVIKFVMLMEDLNFSETLKLLAERVGLEVEYHKIDEVATRTGRLLELHFRLSEVFSKFLKSDLGKSARDYLRSRDIDAYWWERFKLGFCPDGSIVADALVKMGFSRSELIDSGLFSISGSNLLSKMRNRIMIPICDYAGRVVAFGGRSLYEQDEPKYLNSPETPIYKKGKFLFGWHLARESIKARDRVILVEGYMDVISMHMAGFSETVASLGTSLTREQAERLAMLTRNIFVVYDGDQAGIKASLRASKVFYSLGLEPRIVLLPVGEDPDSLARKDTTMFNKLLESAKTPVEFLKETCGDFRGIFAKREFIERALELVTEVNDPIIVENFVEHLADVTGVTKSSIMLMWQSRRRPVRRVEIVTEESCVKWERALLSLCLKDKNFFESVKDQLDRIEFKDPLVVEVLPKLLEAKNVDTFVMDLDSKLQEKIFPLLFEDLKISRDEMKSILKRKLRESEVERIKRELMELKGVDREKLYEKYKVLVSLKKGIEKGGLE